MKNIVIIAFAVIIAVTVLLAAYIQDRQEVKNSMDITIEQSHACYMDNIHEDITCD
jgi:hypothetical protein